MKARVGRGHGAAGLMRHLMDEGQKATGLKNPEIVGGTLTVTGLSTEPIDDEMFRVPTVHTTPAPVSDRQRIIDRLEILSAIDSAVERREEVLAVIDESSTVDDARARIIDLLSVQEVGADAVLAMQLRRLVAVERDKISDEVASLRAHLAGHDE